MTKVLIQSNVDGCRKVGRPRRNWIDDIKTWSNESLSGLCRRAEDRNDGGRMSINGCTYGMAMLWFNDDDERVLSIIWAQVWLPIWV